MEDRTLVRNNATTKVRVGTQNNKVKAADAPGKEEEFLQTVTGDTDVIKLLLRAVNNRTIERDYFRLYCDMLDASISEEEFDKTIADNEADYVVSETDEPDEQQIRKALQLIRHIKGVHSINDVAALFSFNPATLDAIAAKSDD